MDSHVGGAGVPDLYGVLQAMAAGLRERGVTHVVMEASGVHTEPVYYALAERDFEQVAVTNPAHAKALKGQKTDAKDALRLAELFECGLLRGSYIPPEELKDLRDLTRYRVKTVQARTAEIQRLAKALESAAIKLSCVLTDLHGVTGRDIMGQLIAGERNPKVLAELARATARRKISRLEEALEGAEFFTGEHAALLAAMLARIDRLNADIGQLSQAIERLLAPHEEQLAQAESMPGWGPPRRTPRFLISARTRSQYLAPSPSPCSPAHRPSTSRSRSAVTPKAR